MLSAQFSFDCNKRSNVNNFLQNIYFIREETYRFLCAIEHDVLLLNENELMAKRKISVKAAATFSKLNSLSTISIDNEHKKSWKTVIIFCKIIFKFK